MARGATILLLLVASTGCAQATPTVKPLDYQTRVESVRSTTEGLRIVVEPHHDVPTARVKLVNTGKTSLWVNARLATRHRAERFSELDVEAIGPQPPAGVSCTSGHGYARDEDYVLLRPADELSRRISLKCIISVPSAAWKATFRYHDTNPNPPRPPRGADLYVGTAVSDVIELGPF